MLIRSVIVVGIMLLLLVLTILFAFIISARFKQINELEEEGLQELVKQINELKEEELQELVKQSKRVKKSN